MLLWLNGTQNVKEAPNENYGREMMELFTLGADRGAYTEDDVREQARVADRLAEPLGAGAAATTTSTSTPTEHDDGVKTVFRHGARFDWKTPCRLCVGHPLHASFFVNKLWSYFVPTPPDRADRRRRSRRSTSSGYQMRPVARRDPAPPGLYAGRAW